MHSRRTFFAATAAATLAVAGSDGDAAAEPARYDLAAIEACLNLPFKHRQVFTARRLGDGAIAGLMLNSLNAYQFDYREGAGTLHTLGIWYGSAVAMLVDDDAWRTYKLDVVQQRRGDPSSGAIAAAGNPYLRGRSALDASAARTNPHGIYHDASLIALAKRNASFFACNNALSALASDITVTYGLSDLPAETVYADLRRRLVPGTILVPAGVAAVNQAQEKKFTLLPASA